MDEIAGWHHQLNGHEFEQTLGDGEGQGSLVCYSPWGHRVRHDLATEQQQKIISNITEGGSHSVECKLHERSENQTGLL